MKKPISFGKLDVHVVSSLEEARGRLEAGEPFRILIMGDFSGRGGAKDARSAAKGGRRPIQVDRDNFDEVMAKLSPELQLTIFGEKSPPVVISFSELDDFHPDQLFERLDIFQALRDARQGFKDPSSAAAFSRGLARRGGGEQPAQGISDSIIQSVSGQTAGSLLDEILEGPEREMPARSSSASPPPSAWEAFLQEIVAPHLAPDMEPEQQEMVAATEAAMAELMRVIMHHADFQALEANWRGLNFLTTRIETNEDLQLHLLDISKADLKADLAASEDLTSTRLYQLLIKDVEEDGVEPWGAIAGIYTFNDSVEDVELLGRLAKLAAQARAPFVSAASPLLLGCRDLSATPDPRNWRKQLNSEVAAAWEALRGLSETIYVGLALPRFLLRLPYGAKTEPIDRFDFEEMAEPIEHEHYLWGNPAFVCACLLAQAFTEDGWDFQPGSVQDIEDLPLHVFKRQGESVTLPCAEVLLTLGAAEAILDAGLMPLLSFKNQDVIRLARFQSISNATEPLHGGWKTG